jgi:hypothetical protein
MGIAGVPRRTGRGDWGPVSGLVLVGPGPDRAGGRRRDGPGVAGRHPTPGPGRGLGGAGAGHGGGRLGRVAVPGGWAGRGPGPPAGQDGADLAGHPGRLRGECGDGVRGLGAGVLVGAGPADRAHAVGPLAGDAGPRPGLGRPGRPAARPGRAGRVEAHRRVPPGGPRAPATGWWPGRWAPTRPCRCGWRRSGSRPPWPGSGGWSPRPRRLGLGPRPWPTGPRCCSGWRWGRAGHRGPLAGVGPARPGHRADRDRAGDRLPHALGWPSRW